MDYKIKYLKIKHGYARIGEDGILKLSIPIKLKNDEKFKKRLLEKGKILLEKHKKYKKIETFGKDYVILFGEKIKNTGFIELNKKDREEVLKKLLYEKSIPLLDKYSKLIGKNYISLKIKNLKSKWGSCSSDQKIVLNLKLIFLPENFLEYVIIHEVCHLKEKNHSKNFWKLVEGFLLNYKEVRRELKMFLL